MLKQLDLRGVLGDLTRVLPRPESALDPPIEAVRAILAEVKARGDAAIREFTQKFDGVDVYVSAVPRSEALAALDALDPPLRQALEEAAASIGEFHRHEMSEIGPYERNGIEVRSSQVPVARAGVYVPGGRALYPSSVLMTAIPARVAGVDEIVLCVPPGPDAKVPAVTLAAAAIAGVDEIYRIGGAQAVAAMAYGTESIAPVDVIAGPGNIYVALAKREVAGYVGVPSAFAGPSEVVVVADESVPAVYAAIDIVVQAEHGPDGLAWLVTWSNEVAEAVDEQVRRLVDESPRRDEIRSTLADGGYAVIVDGPAQAMDVANTIAPEHLELMCRRPEQLAGLVRNAGAVFLGPYAPASVGDYLAGPSHVLPTHGSARFAGALGTSDFTKAVHFVTMDGIGLARVAPHVAAIAQAEGLAAHAASVLIRQDDSGAALPRPGAGAAVTSMAAPGEQPASKAAASSPGPRPDVAVMAGYHSPQLDVRVRLNTNESPYPPPQAWRDDVSEALAGIDFHRYPDRQATTLRQALGDLHGVGPENVFCANGSNEVIECLLLAYGGPGRKAATFEPTYALHSHIARLTSTAVVSRARRPADFSLDERAVYEVLDREQPDVVFLCSPNNPTGGEDSPGLTKQILDRAKGLVVIDEAYGQFASASVVDWIHDFPNLGVIRTFSKTWAMAGWRIGYLVAPAPIVEAVEKVALPYHLDAFKQEAGRLALSYRSDMEERVAQLIKGREVLEAGMAAAEVHYWPSGANFVLFRPDRPARSVWEGLVQRSVLVRDCSSWPGLGGCLRVSVGTPEENDAFLTALEEVLG
ncbi:MAG: histidinol dehydrogenase [Acidimicrobiales bacterium]